MDLLYLGHLNVDTLPTVVLTTLTQDEESQSGNFSTITLNLNNSNNKIKLYVGFEDTLHTLNLNISYLAH